MEIELENEKRRHKRKITFLIIWFFFLIIFLTTITYAWFTSNRIVDLQFFDIHVETDNGIEVSENAIDWKSTITLEEFKNAYKTYPSSVNQIPGTMRPVSTGGLLDNNGYLNMFYGQADSNGTTEYYLSTYRQIEKRSTSEKNEGDFVVFDIFIRTSTPKSLYLSSESYVKYKGEETLGIENSSRIAFIKEGTVPMGSSANVSQSLKTSDNNRVIIWEPNYDVHTKYGVTHAKDVYGITTTETNAGILPYDGVISAITLTNRIKIKDANANNYNNLFKRVNIGIYTKSDNTDNKKMMDLDSGITKIRIYMWLEGQDVDSENKASHGNISYFLKFTLNP